MTLSDQLRATAESLREAIRWRESSRQEIGRIIVILSEHANTLASIGSPECSRIDRIITNLRVGLYHLDVNPGTLTAYATGAIAELDWLASDLRKQEEAA